MMQNKSQEVGNALLDFVKHPVTVLITIAALLLILFSFQEKRVISLSNFQQSRIDIITEQTNPYPLSDNQTKNTHQYQTRYELPIHSYGGPAILEIQSSSNQAIDKVFAKIPARWSAHSQFDPDVGTSKKFFLYPGSLEKGGLLSVEMSTRIPSLDEFKKLNRNVTLSFPKAGHWLIPDIRFWISLVLICLSLSAAAHLFWNSLPVALSSYALITLIITFAIYLWGFDFAARLGTLLPAAIILFLAVGIFRIVRGNSSELEAQQPEPNTTD